MDNEIYLKRKYKHFSEDDNLNEPLAIYNAKVHRDWIDYNGHMSESFYLYAFGDASDALFQYIGIDNNYRLAGQSFYTVETHINYYLEASELLCLQFLKKYGNLTKN